MLVRTTTVIPKEAKEPLKSINLTGISSIILPKIIVSITIVFLSFISISENFSSA